jgi:hypothetical protein
MTHDHSEIIKLEVALVTKDFRIFDKEIQYSGHTELV